MTSWYQSDTVRGLDTETSGVDPFNDRIVTAAIVDIHPGRRPEVIHWTIDPGQEIAEEATAVHGYTRDRVLDLVGGEGMALRIGDGKNEQMPAVAALGELAGLTAMAMHREIPLVVANAPFDLTLLEAELGRHGIDTLASRPSGIRGVVDPMVLDRAFDTYRKACYRAPGCDPEAGTHVCGGCRGSRQHDCGGCGVTDRKLESLCRHYGVPLVDAHDAAADALAACPVGGAAGWAVAAGPAVEARHAPRAPGDVAPRADGLATGVLRQEGPRARRLLRRVPDPRPLRTGGGGMTMFNDDAARFATSDRVEHADRLLTAAVREGIAAFRLAHRMERAGFADASTGLVDAVAITLVTAGADAERVLGPGSGTEAAS